MKKKATITILLTVLMSMGSTKALAYDIEVANADGVTIYYNYINNGTELEVSKENDSGGASYSGSVVIPENVTFMGRTRKVTSIGATAFDGCGLTSVTIPNSVTKIGSYAFYGCKRLKSVTIPYKVGSIGAHAFQNCSGLKSVNINIEEGFTAILTIGDYAFYGCSGLMSVTFPKSVLSIGEYAFQECLNLTSVTIEKRMNIGRGAFWYCNRLTSVTIHSIEAWCGMKFGDSDSNPLSYAHHLFLDDNEITNLEIPDGVTSIGAYAFLNCSSLTSVTIPNTVESIGSSAFGGVDILSVTSYILKPFNIGAFSKNTINNATLYVPEGSVNKYKNTNGWNFLFFEEMPLGDIDGLYYSLDYDNLTATVIYNASYSGNIQIPNSIYKSSFSVTAIGENAFKGCSGLNSITIPNSVTSIGKNAFNGCSGLTSVHITDLEAWCKMSFNDNPLYYAHHLYMNEKEIKDLFIPSSVSSISELAFSGCSGLTSVTIPNSVTTIEENAFNGCSGLTSVRITDLAAWCKITFKDNPLNYAHHLYLNGKEIKDLAFPSSVSSISELAFSGCSGLASVTFGENVSSIQSKSFADCTQMTDVYCLAESAPNTASDAFDNTSINASLHVHTLSLDNYKKADPWKNFKNIVSIEPQCAKPTITYNNGKIAFSCETEDVEFHYSISNIYSRSGIGSEVLFLPTVTISVYASKYGFPTSETATMRLAVPSDLTGDLNGDGEVNEADHEILSNIILEK